MWLPKVTFVFNEIVKHQAKCVGRSVAQTTGGPSLSSTYRSDLTCYFFLPSNFKALCFLLKRAICSFPNMACSFLPQLLPIAFPAHCPSLSLGGAKSRSAFLLAPRTAPSSMEPSWKLPDVIRCLTYPHSSAFSFILQFSGFRIDP